MSEDRALDAGRWQSALRRRRKAEKALRAAKTNTELRAAAIALDLAQGAETKAKQEWDEGAVSAAARSLQRQRRCCCSPGITSAECPEHG